MKTFLYITGIMILTAIIVRTVRAGKRISKKMIQPAFGRITSPFGERIHPITKEKQFHNGVDIALKTGTELKTPFEAEVKKVSFNDIGGKQVVLFHPKDGYFTGYAHLSQILVKAGDKLKKGEVFALSGNTGRSTGPHLHFTLSDKEGNKINPQKLFTFSA